MKDGWTAVRDPGVKCASPSSGLISPHNVTTPAFSCYGGRDSDSAPLPTEPPTHRIHWCSRNTHLPSPGRSAANRLKTPNSDRRNWLATALAHDDTLPDKSVKTQGI